MGRLAAQGALVEGIADQAQGEDGQGEAIAAVEGVAARELREGFVVVFGARRRVPEGGVEDDGARCDCGLRGRGVWSVR